MGSSASASASKDNRHFTYLIGDISKKSDIEQRFYNLCHAVNFTQAKKPHKKPLSVDSDDETDYQDEFSIDSSGKSEHNDEFRYIAETQGKREATHERKENERHRVKGNIPGCSLFRPLPVTQSIFSTQTYISWRACYDMETVVTLFQTRKRTIYLLPIGEFPDFIHNCKLPLSNRKEFSLFEVIERFIEIFFLGMKVKWMETLRLESTKWKVKSRLHKKTEMQQYLVSSFYPDLQRYKPKDGYCIMGMTWTDLYPKEELNFVLGEASFKHRSGVFSFGRFEPKVYNKELHQDITAVTTHVLWKVLKVCSHELGHLFGITHCQYFMCCMNASCSVQEALSQPLFLCPVCIRKLQHVCKFNILERYEQLQQFLVAINAAMPSEKWQDSVNWVKDCLYFLSNTEDSTYL